MDFHPKCIQSAKEKLVDTLQGGKVTSNRFVSFDTFVKLSAIEKVFPTNGEMYDELLGYVGDDPVTTFLLQEVQNRIIAATLSEESCPDRDLSELEPFKDIENVSNELIASLCSLPWGYSLSVRLADELAEIIPEGGRLELSSNTWLEISKQIGSHRQGENALKSLFFQGPPISESLVKFCSRVRGYVGYGQRGGPLFSFSEEVKCFLGLGLALGLFSLAPKASVSYKNWIVAEPLDDDTDAEEVRSEIDSDVRNLIARFRVSESARKAGLTSGMSGQLSGIENCFKLRPKTDRILSASLWYFDGHSSSNDLLNFIQTMVSMEILLGDKQISDDIGIGKLLGSRCAYLIGRSLDDREDIENNIKEIYSLRSKIIHNGHSRLSRSQGAMLERLRLYCRRSINKEVALSCAE